MIQVYSDCTGADLSTNDAIWQNLVWWERWDVLIDITLKNWKELPWLDFQPMPWASATRTPCIRVRECIANGNDNDLEQ